MTACDILLTAKLQPGHMERMKIPNWPRVPHMNGDDDLDAVRAEIERIHRRADDRVAHDRRRLESFYSGAPDQKRTEILNRTVRRDREEEDRELNMLAARLSARARAQLFKETLDPHFQP